VEFPRRLRPRHGATYICLFAQSDDLVDKTLYIFVYKGITVGLEAEGHGGVTQRQRPVRNLAGGVGSLDLPRLYAFPENRSHRGATVFAETDVTGRSVGSAIKDVHVPRECRHVHADPHLASEWYPGGLAVFKCYPGVDSRFQGFSTLARPLNRRSSIGELHP
jgi:hypothetical protein